jgi:ankyrin repeat protein
MMAAQHGNVDLVRALLEHGASALRVDSGGIDAGVWARRRKNWRVLSMIEAAKKKQEREAKQGNEDASRSRL